MMNSTIIAFILSLIFMTSAYAERKNYIFKTTESNIAFENTVLKSEKKEVNTHYHWLQLKDLPVKYVELFKVQQNLPQDTIILFVNSTFTINKPIDFFSKELYDNTKFLSSLSGMDYERSRNDLEYDVSFSPIILKYINAKAKLLFPEQLNEYQSLAEVESGSKIIHLKSYEFSSDLYQSDIISVFRSISDTETKVDNISFAIITDTTFGGIILKTKRGVMISKLKKQTKIMLKTYLKN